MQIKNIQGQEIWRPGIHFTPKKGWINDPNGLLLFQGEYHLFYQYNPFHCCWDSMHWGHAVSRDLLHWEELEIALFPDSAYDGHPEGGCFSGSAVQKDDKLYLLYTGSVKRDGKTVQTQCLAVSQDGRHFEKAAGNPVIAEPPRGAGEDFRDPRVVLAQGRYRLLCGGTDKRADDPAGHGRIYLYSSDDLYHWDYNGILYEAEPGEGSMFECPDIFRVGDQWVIAASPMHRRDHGQNIYMQGRLDFDSCRFVKEKQGVLDAGTHYYAGQTYSIGERPVSIAWLGGWGWMPWINSLPPADSEGYRGTLCVPRTFGLDGEGNLFTAFAPELSEFERDRLVTENVSLSRMQKIFSERLKHIQHTLHMKLWLDCRGWKEKLLLISLQEGEGRQIVFSLDFAAGRGVADYERADRYSRHGIREFELESIRESLEVELLLDRSVCTVFLNGGRHAYTTTFYPAEGQAALSFFSPEEVMVEKVELGMLSNI